MERSDFQPEFPGRLVDTRFSDGATQRVGVAFVPDLLPPSFGDSEREQLVGRLFESWSEADRRLTRLDARLADLPDSAVFMRAMRTREAQASSRIENTVVSLDELLRVEATGVQGDSASAEVVRNIRALEAAASDARPVCVALALHTHRVLMPASDTRAGKVRTTQLFIGSTSRGFGSARFVPPPAEAVEGCLGEWEKFCNPGAVGIAPRARWPWVLELAMAHYQFEAIHPFHDGNGRVGRILVHVGPMKQGWLAHPVCNLSEWVQDHRQEYYDALLRVSTHRDWEGWFIYFCGALAAQATSDLTRVERLLAAQDRMYRLCRGSSRMTAKAVALIDLLIGWPYLTIPMAAQRLGVSYDTARRLIQRFVELSILAQVGEAKYDRLFVAGAVRDAIRGDRPD